MDFLEQLKRMEKQAQNYRYGQARQNLKELQEHLKKAVDKPAQKAV